MNETQARKPLVITVNGCRIGFLSLMQRYDLYVKDRLYASGSRGGPRRFRLAEAQADLAALEGQVDVRVALVHWGRNYHGVTARQRKLAGTLRASGVDAVIGHHPHVPQPFDLRGGRPVFYSLGNGPIGTPGRFHSGRPPYGLVATIDFDRTGVSAVHVRLVAVDNSRVRFRPVPEDGPEGVRFLRSLVSPTDGWTESPLGGLTARSLARTAAGVDSTSR